MSTEQHHDTVLVVQATKTAKPPMFAVFLLNDDYTPMEFVVHILMLIFVMSQDDAMRTMLKVHNEGKGLCGVYTREIAEHKVAEVLALAREREHPLVCVMEESK